MALDKSIKKGREHRKEYLDSRSFDPQCRNNNYCPICKKNRTFQSIKGKQSQREQLNGMD